jgi:glycosyltransferase involved in cell wall biosynthesis
MTLAPPKRKSHPCQQPGAPATPGRHLHVVILAGGGAGFPHGMAPTNRIRLLGRSLVEQNVDVRVLCTGYSDRPGSVRNQNVRGTFAGISYEYTCGSTVRSDSFVARRYREARGYATALVRLVGLQRSRKVDCVYLWAVGGPSWRMLPWLMVRFLNFIRVPVMIELNERPRAASRLPRAIDKHLSPFDGVSGAVAISVWLVSWSSMEGKRIGRSVGVVEIPIVVDVSEQDSVEYGHEDPLVVYAASPGYYDTALAFILTAMRQVWQQHPECRLVVTGLDAEAAAGGGWPMGSRSSTPDERVVFVGYVDREKLLELYGQSRALLIPLFDDDRSRARFPSKIGEYLAAARPAVTTHVGEIDRYLTDRETAYVSAPGDAAAYAENIVAILDDPVVAAAVGSAGRRLAEERFHYSLHGANLRAFVESLAKQ